MRRERPKPVRLTAAAADRARELLESRGGGRLRVGVKNGGCAGMEYVMAVCDNPEAGDEVVREDGFDLVIDAKAILFLLGSTIDYEVTPLHAKFVFRNPNETDACGCGESVSIRPASLTA
jgi:iron-sulfur cluster assembly protein